MTKFTTIHENSVIARGFGRVDYCDRYCIVKSTNDSAEKIAAKMLKMPMWVNWLMNIRHSIVRVFGLKTKKDVREGQTSYFTLII